MKTKTNVYNNQTTNTFEMACIGHKPFETIGFAMNCWLDCIESIGISMCVNIRSLIIKEKKNNQK